MGKDTNKKFNLKKISRLIPTLIGLCIIGSFLYYKPDQVKKLYSAFTERFTNPLQKRVLPPSPDYLLTQINTHRKDEKLSPLDTDDSLLELSKLLALDVANSNTGQPTLNLEKTAKSLDINYIQIAYLVIIQSQSSVQTIDNLLWSEENKTTFLSKDYKSAGIYTIETKDENQSIITVISLATISNKSSQSAPIKLQAPRYYTGIELWTEIQKYRREKGVPEFKQDNTLCTLTSIRVNQLLKLNELDDHNGFEPLVNQYRNEGKLSFGNLGENILKGYPTAAEAVKAWDSSLGHRALMSDGSYVWGCASANYGFAVLIAAY